jgi:putative transposase
MVFVTKYRRKVITEAMLERLTEIFANICIKTKCHTQLRSNIVVETDTETRGHGDTEKMNVLRMNATWYQLTEFSGEADHVHLLVDFHPDNRLSALIGSMKSGSSRIIQKEFATELAKVYKQPAFWSGSYYVASTGGAPIERVKAYIKSQEVPRM